MITEVDLICFECGRRPSEIEEYVAMAAEQTREIGRTVTPEKYVMREEGTLNRENGHFACDTCYIKIGMPAEPAPARWVAP